MKPLSLEQQKMVSEFYGWNNYLKISNLQRPPIITDENKCELRTLFGSLLIRLKRHAKRNISQLLETTGQYNEYHRILREAKNQQFKNQDDIDWLTKYVHNLDQLTKSCESTLALLGDTMIDYFEVYSQVASDEDIASLLSVNITKVKRARARFEKEDKDEKSDFLTFCLFVERLEEYGQDIFFECLFQRIMRELETNRAFKAKSNEMLMEMCWDAGVKPLQVQMDSDGNIVSAKEIYPPLRVVQ